MSNLDKDQLTQQMNSKNRELLLQTDGIASLFIFNLENFAYRYLETSTDKSIVCQVEGKRFWVESIEPQVFEALKWENSELKPILIALCKKYPGSQSKELKVRLVLETSLVEDKKVECVSHIICIAPDKENNQSLTKKVEMSFDDPIELRNKHAALLEDVAEVFL